MASGFEKLQSALDLYKLEDLFTSRRQLVLNKLGLGGKANIFEDQNFFRAIDSLFHFIEAPNNQIQNSVNQNQRFWSAFDDDSAFLNDLQSIYNEQGKVQLLDPVNPESIILDLKEKAKSFRDVLLEISLDDIHQKREKFAKEYEEKFKEFNNLDRIALFNAVKIKDSKQVADFKDSYVKLEEQIKLLEGWHHFITSKFKKTNLQKQAEKELELIELNLIECRKVQGKMRDIQAVMTQAAGNDYLALDNGVKYSVKTEQQYQDEFQDYKSKADGSQFTKASKGKPEEKKNQYLTVDRRKEGQVGIFEKNYPGAEASSYEVRGDASDPHWTSTKSPKDEALLAEHTTRWAIDIIRQNGMPTEDNPLYIEEGSVNPKESKFLVIALMKVLNITSREKANLLIKTDHTDWEPADELAYIGGGFSRFSDYNAFKDNKDVQKILANFENKNVVKMEAGGKDYKYEERIEPKQSEVQKQEPKESAKVSDVSKKSVPEVLSTLNEKELLKSVPESEISKKSQSPVLKPLDKKEQEVKVIEGKEVIADKKVEKAVEKKEEVDAEKKDEAVADKKDEVVAENQDPYNLETGLNLSMQELEKRKQLDEQEQKDMTLATELSLDDLNQSEKNLVGSGEDLDEGIKKSGRFVEVQKDFKEQLRGNNPTKTTDATSTQPDVDNEENIETVYSPNFGKK